MLVLWCAITLVYWPSTSGVAPDSVTYIDAAESIAAGRGFEHRWAYWDPVYALGVLPTRTSLWPPGVPMAIAAGIELGLDPVLAGQLLSFASSVGVALLLFFWSRTIVPAQLAFLSAGVSVVLTQQTLMVASEPLFLFAATVALVCCVRALGADRDINL
jgi:hypothetical protein